MPAERESRRGEPPETFTSRVRTGGPTPGASRACALVRSAVHEPVVAPQRSPPRTRSRKLTRSNVPGGSSSGRTARSSGSGPTPSTPWMPTPPIGADREQAARGCGPALRRLDTPPPISPSSPSSPQRKALDDTSDLADDIRKSALVDVEPERVTLAEMVGGQGRFRSNSTPAVRG